jgi:hypothetical protein
MEVVTTFMILMFLLKCCDYDPRTILRRKERAKNRGDETDQPQNDIEKIR